MNQPTIDELGTSALNTHGFSYQFATIKAFEDVFSKENGKWAFVASEFPVQCKGHSTHIDSIYSCGIGQPLQSYLVCECKRANPATDNWIFAKAPYVYRNSGGDELCFDSIEVDGKSSIPAVSKPYRTNPSSIGAYHIGIATNSRKKGDGNADVRDINSTVSQSLRASSGLIDYIFAKNGLTTSVARITRFIPAIITTASLYVTDARLELASLSDGNLEAAGPFTKVTWLWFLHNRSFEISHSQMQAPAKDFRDAIRMLHSRAVAVISSDGIQNFARMNFHDVYFD